MAIQSEIIDNTVVRHWSDAGVKLRQIETDTLWNDAVDVLPCRYTYEETDIPMAARARTTIAPCTPFFSSRCRMYGLALSGSKVTEKAPGTASFNV